MISFKQIIVEQHKILKQKINEFTELFKSNRDKKVKDILYVL
jgi:hypothetical protein